MSDELPGWGTTIDPVGNCPADFDESGLVLTVPGGLHDMNPWLGSTHAPRILNPVSGDFLFEVRVSDIARPEPKSGVQGHQAYVAAGILLWGDEDNLLRWTRSASGDRGVIYLSCEQYENKKIVGAGNFPLEDKPIWLRLERRGDRLILSATYDKSGWRTLLERRCKYPADMKVGVFGLNVTKRDVEFRFEDSYLLGKAPSDKH
ncbi:hypothetical protein GC197_18375 [bacterium]|nr:hypothetical protein [bacterium]